jgi:hypothetical protein
MNENKFNKDTFQFNNTKKYTIWDYIYFFQVLKLLPLLKILKNITMSYYLEINGNHKFKLNQKCFKFKKKILILIPFLSFR